MSVSVSPTYIIPYPGTEPSANHKLSCVWYKCYGKMNGLKNQPLSSYASPHIRVPLQNFFSCASDSIDCLLYAYVCHET